MIERLATMSPRKISKRRSGVSDVSDAGLAGGAMVALRLESEIDLLLISVLLVLGRIWMCYGRESSCVWLLHLATFFCLLSHQHFMGLRSCCLPKHGSSNSEYQI